MKTRQEKKEGKRNKVKEEGCEERQAVGRTRQKKNEKMAGENYKIKGMKRQ